MHRHQIGYATCDNAANNGTMLVEFGRLVKATTGTAWDPVERRIKSVDSSIKRSPSFNVSSSCLAHVINIATQKLISAYSKSPHFNAHDPTAHIPDTSVGLRDEIGLVRAIAVKVWDSFPRQTGTYFFPGALILQAQGFVQTHSIGHSDGHRA
jgi:hypothetical protein